ncbi:hypothetical protein IAR50_001649 [Cryptococcus sp. DSM 104548]
MSVPPPAPFSSPPLPIPSPTILAHLQTLSHPRTSLPLSLPYLHPYAPLSTRPGPSTLLPGEKGGKGKSKEKTEGELVRELREGVKFWRGVVEGQGEETRLHQALKEVLTHQSTILSTSSALLPLPSAQLPAYPGLSSIPPNLAPSTLLQTLSSLAGLQTFLEDSQFGLQQASLAIAGERVVVDVDLGVDVAGGEGEEGDGEESRMGTPMGAASVAATPAPAPSVGDAGPATGREDRPKIKLLKLEASHVTPKGATGQSAHIKLTLTHLIEQYLELYNSFPPPSSTSLSPDSPDFGKQDDGGKSGLMEEVIKHLENELRSLKRIDDVACAEGEGEGVVDWFEEVEKVAGGVNGLFGESSEYQLYPAERPCIFPSFRLLPSSSSPSSPSETRTEESGPTWQIRPALFHLNENVPPVSSSPQSSQGEPSGDGGDITMDSQEAGGGWLASEWVIECLDPSGVVCSRQWLLADEEAHEDERDEAVGQVGSRIESLLYRPYQQPSFMPQQSQQQAFPYTLPFVRASQGSANETDGLEQHWSIAHPGPAGWVVGRVGLGRKVEGLQRAIVALRRQTVINQLFSNIFKTEYCRPYEVDASSVPDPNGETNDVDDGIKKEDEDEEMAEDDCDDDWLSASQKSIPCSLTILPSAYFISLPILSAEGSIRYAQVSVKPSPTSNDGYVQVGIQVDGENVEGISGDGVQRDLVAIVDKVVKMVKG